MIIMIIMIIINIIIIIMLIIKLIHFLGGSWLLHIPNEAAPSDDHPSDCHFIQISGNLTTIMRILFFWTSPIKNQIEKKSYIWFYMDVISFDMHLI